MFDLGDIESDNIGCHLRTVQIDAYGCSELIAHLKRIYLDILTNKYKKRSFSTEQGLFRLLGLVLYDIEDEASLLINKKVENNNILHLLSMRALLFLYSRLPVIFL